MDKKTLNALKESIEKWEMRAAGNHSLHVGASCCPLCKLFHADCIEIPDEKCCIGCPVFESTNLKYCQDTPYHAYFKERTDSIAQREVDFLKSLLPSEEAKEEAKSSFSWASLDYLR